MHDAHFSLPPPLSRTTCNLRATPPLLAVVLAFALVIVCKVSRHSISPCMHDFCMISARVTGIRIDYLTSRGVISLSPLSTPPCRHHPSSSQRSHSQDRSQLDNPFINLVGHGWVSQSNTRTPLTYCACGLPKEKFLFRSWCNFPIRSKQSWRPTVSVWKNPISLHCTFFRIITFFRPWQESTKRVFFDSEAFSGDRHADWFPACLLSKCRCSSANFPVSRSTNHLTPIQVARTRKSPADIWWRLDRNSKHHPQTTVISNTTQ